MRASPTVALDQPRPHSARPPLDTTSPRSDGYMEESPISFQRGYGTPAKVLLDSWGVEGSNKGSSGGDNSGSRTRALSSAVLSRARKPGMSVQERLGRILGGHRPGTSVQGVHEDSEEFVYSGEGGEYEAQRLSSSLSGRAVRERDGPPVTEWLGPRTVKAFKAAGLLDS